METRHFVPESFSDLKRRGAWRPFGTVQSVSGAAVGECQISFNGSAIGVSSFAQSTLLPVSVPLLHITNLPL